MVSARAMIEAGRIRPLASLSRERIALLPNVPALSEGLCAVRDMLAAREVFKDSATELAKALAGHVSERTLKRPFWPKTPAALGSHLMRIGTAPRTARGIVAGKSKGGAQSSRWWSLRRLWPCRRGRRRRPSAPLAGLPNWPKPWA